MKSEIRRQRVGATKQRP